MHALRPVFARCELAAHWGSLRLAWLQVGYIGSSSRIPTSPGREVALLAAGPCGPGRFQVAWSGDTGHGSAPAGLYFVRLQVGIAR